MHVSLGDGGKLLSQRLLEISKIASCSHKKFGRIHRAGARVGWSRARLCPLSCLGLGLYEHTLDARQRATAVAISPMQMQGISEPPPSLDELGQGPRTAIPWRGPTHLAFGMLFGCALLAEVSNAVEEAA